MKFFRNFPYFILIGAFLCFVQNVAAQPTFILKGLVLEKTTVNRLSHSVILNLENEKIVTTNELGVFIIETSIGDNLIIKKDGYETIKLKVENKGDVIAYLTPLIQLSEVKVTAKTKQKELNSIIDNYRNKGLYFDGRPPLIIFNPISGSPLTGFHELFGRDAANERQFVKFSNNEIETIEINKRYTKQLVKQITSLSDTDVIKFIDRYTPNTGKSKNGQTMI